MKKIFVCVVAMLFHTNAFAITMGEAIDRAGQQRMLSQRIAQSFLLTGMQPQSQRHQAQLDRAINKFQENLDLLREFKEGAPAIAQLQAVARLWTSYKNMAEGERTKDNARQLLLQSDELLPAAHAYVVSLQGLSSNKGAELVNVAGRQRMLSQRIAKNYLAKYWGVGTEKHQEELYEDLAEYETMLQYLKVAEINTDELTRDLLKTEGHFKYASKGFDGDMTLKGDRLIFVITGTTDTMLRNMDVITKKYAKVLDSQEAIASR